MSPGAQERVEALELVLHMAQQYEAAHTERGRSPKTAQARKAIRALLQAEAHPGAGDVSGDDFNLTRPAEQDWWTHWATAELLRERARLREALLAIAAGDYEGRKCWEHKMAAAALRPESWVDYFDDLDENGDTMADYQFGQERET